MYLLQKKFERLIAIFPTSVKNVNTFLLTITLLSPDSLEEPTHVAAGDKLFLCKTFAGEASKLACT